MHDKVHHLRHLNVMMRILDLKKKIHQGIMVFLKLVGRYTSKTSLKTTHCLPAYNPLSSWPAWVVGAGSAHYQH